ncbi:MAG: IS5 family transposase [Nitrososphaera sp.]|nr:IS5 family transposase [Nitrososphaera sp.]
MARSKSLPTIWEVPDDLWERIEQLLNEHDPPKTTGRSRADARRILDGIIFRFRTGCQWNHIPKVYGDDSTIHRTFQRWVEINLFEMIWYLLAAECDELALVDWEWQAADGWLGKARSGGDEIGPNPTDRAKNGTKKSVLTDAAGGPLSVVIAPANVNDHKLLEATIEAMVIERPEPTEQEPQNLCLDKGYDNKASREVVKKRGYKDHIRRIGEEKLDRKGKKKHPARRYVVERTLAWLSKCRGLLIRYERKSENYLAQLQFACALLWYRRLPALATAFP